MKNIAEKLPAEKEVNPLHHLQEGCVENDSQLDEKKLAKKEKSRRKIPPELVERIRNLRKKYRAEEENQ